MKEIKNSKNSQQGFTLIELVVVVAIIGLLAAFVAPQFIKQGEKAESQAAKAQIEALGVALDTFRLDVGRYPTSQEGLSALNQRPGGVERWDGPYLKKELPNDPWGNPYVYKSPGDEGRSYDIITYGVDKAPGGEGNAKDVTSWQQLQK